MLMDMGAGYDRCLLKECMRQAYGQPGVRLTSIGSVSHLTPPRSTNVLAFWPRGCPDVLLGAFRNKAWIRWADQLPIPTINLSDNQIRWRGHQVVVDSERMVEMAVAHLFRKGIREIRMVSYEHPGVLARKRSRLIEEKVKQRGGRFHPTLELNGDPEKPDIVKAFSNLSGHHGVITCTSGAAAEFILFLDRLGVSVPLDVAVIALDQDEFCEGMCGRRVSAVYPDYAAFAETALQLAVELVRGSGQHEIQRRQVPPVEREEETTQILAVPDPVVAKLIRMIHGAEGEWPDVNALSRMLGLSRRSLELRFRKQTGTSIGKYTVERKLLAAERLVRDSMLPIDDVAESAGYSDRSTFHVAFKKRFGLAPVQYRNQRHI